jgi:hypothetical protein
MPDHCGCSLTSRCAAAWMMRERLRLLPVDGSETRRFARARLALEYTHHLEDAGLAYHHTGLLWPLWADEAFGARAAQPAEETPCPD